MKENDGNVQAPHPSLKGVSKGICVINSEYDSSQVVQNGAEVPDVVNTVINSRWF